MPKVMFRKLPLECTYYGDDTFKDQSGDYYPAAEHDAVVAELDSWQSEVSKEMPSDFKDFWNNSKKEWPLVARLVLEARRKRTEELHGVEDRLARMVELVEKAIDKNKGSIEEAQNDEGFGFHRWKYRVIDRNGFAIHHTDSRSDAQYYLEKCRNFWREQELQQAIADAKDVLK